MKLVEQDGVTALLLTEPEREILRKALKNVKPKVLEPAEGIILHGFWRVWHCAGAWLRGGRGLVGGASAGPK